MRMRAGASLHPAPLLLRHRDAPCPARLLVGFIGGFLSQCEFSNINFSDAAFTGKLNAQEKQK